MSKPRLPQSRCIRGDARPSPGDGLKDGPAAGLEGKLKPGVGKATGCFRWSREDFFNAPPARRERIQPGFAVRAGHLVLSLAWFRRIQG